jgi:hypothetical protein
MNADWHRANPMPKSATEAQRIAWHREYAVACACRPIPPRRRERMLALGIDPDDAPPPRPETGDAND